MPSIEDLLSDLEHDVPAPPERAENEQLHEGNDENEDDDVDALLDSLMD